MYAENKWAQSRLLGGRITGERKSQLISLADDLRAITGTDAAQGQAHVQRQPPQVHLPLRSGPQPTSYTPPLAYSVEAQQHMMARGAPVAWPQSLKQRTHTSPIPAQRAPVISTLPRGSSNLTGCFRSLSLSRAEAVQQSVLSW
jgi:hypothetical protein